MWKKAVFGTGLAGFLGYVVWASCLSSAPHQIEWDVATRVTERLDRTGFRDVVPVVDGRDVELRGEVASVSEARRAERIVSMVRGVRVVRPNMLVAGEGGLSPHLGKQAFGLARVILGTSQQHPQHGHHGCDPNR